MNRSPRPSERLWVWAFALALILLTSIPYLLGYMNQNPGWVFSGFLFGVEDGNSYIAKMLLGAQGDWLFRSPYSTMEQGGALVYLPYLLLGKLLGPNASHGGLVLLFQAFRTLSIVAVCFATYHFLAMFIRKPAWRRWGLALATLGGGLGWLLLALAPNELPLDFYSPETFGFLAIFGLPHLTLARAMLLWGLVLYLRERHEPAWKISLLWLGMALVHLLAALLGLLVIGLHLLATSVWDRQDASPWAQRLRYPLLAGLAGLPVLAFNGWLLLTDPFTQAWNAQNLILSPAPWHYLLAYGVLLPFAVPGARRMWKSNRSGALALSGWLLALPVLLYAPVNIQRRLADGAWVALIALALQYVEAQDWRQRARWLLVLAFPSTAILLIGAMSAANRTAEPVFRPRAEVAAMQALRDGAEKGEIVLAAFQTGNAVPAWAPVSVVIGHGPETVGLAELRPRVRAFFAGEMSAAEMRGFLVEQRVDYVFWGPAERSLGGWRPESSPVLEEFYADGDYSVFRVLLAP